MWARFINIMKYVWKNPIVQFACFTILEWAVVVFHKSTKNKFKKSKASDILDACAQDYSVGTSESKEEIKPEEKQKAVKQVVVEKQKAVRRSAPKKTIDTIEETKPAKPKRRVRKSTKVEEQSEPVKKPRSRKKKVVTEDKK